MTTEFVFISHGERCAAWHLTADSDALTGQSGRPCVVMAHGFGGTRDSGLMAVAEPSAAAVWPLRPPCAVAATVSSGLILSTILPLPDCCPGKNRARSSRG